MFILINAHNVYYGKYRLDRTRLLIEDRIWTPEGAWVPPGDIRAIPYTRELVRELKRQLAEPQQWKLF